MTGCAFIYQRLSNLLKFENQLSCAQKWLPISKTSCIIPCCWISIIHFRGCLQIFLLTSKFSKILTHCESSFYVIYYSPLGEVGCGPQKISLFSSYFYLRYIQKKTLNTLYCINLHVACDVCFQK